MNPNPSKLSVLLLLHCQGVQCNNRVLLELNSDEAVIHRVSDRIVRRGSITKHGKNWKGADILVYNTCLWWMTGLNMKFLQGTFDDEVKDIVELYTEDYRMAMRSLLRWVKKNMNPEKTRVFFFTSMSPTHAKSIEWGGRPDGNCYNECNILGFGLSEKYNARSFRKSKYPITFVNITQLSNYRKDAHTCVYKKQWSPLTPVSYADCVHWCLPGLQDTWNELFYPCFFLEYICYFLFLYCCVV